MTWRTYVCSPSCCAVHPDNAGGVGVRFILMTMKEICCESRGCGVAWMLVVVVSYLRLSLCVCREPVYWTVLPDCGTRCSSCVVFIVSADPWVSYKMWEVVLWFLVNINGEWRILGCRSGGYVLIYVRILQCLLSTLVHCQICDLELRHSSYARLRVFCR